MIRTELTRRLPEVVVCNLRPQSLKEYEVRELDAPTDFVIYYEDAEPLVVAMFRLTGLIGYTELRMLFCREYSLRHVRETRKIAKQLVRMFGPLVTCVADDFAVGKRFAKFFGFMPLKIEGAGYTLYELRA